MPINPINPMMDMNVNGCPVPSSAGVMPQKTNGKQMSISSTFCQLLNSSRSETRIMNIVIHWRCGHEQEYQSIGTICGNAD